MDLEVTIAALRLQLAEIKKTSALDMPREPMHFALLEDACANCINVMCTTLLCERYSPAPRARCSIEVSASDFPICEVSSLPNSTTYSVYAYADKNGSSMSLHDFATIYARKMPFNQTDGTFRVTIEGLTEIVKLPSPRAAQIVKRCGFLATERDLSTLLENMHRKNPDWSQLHMTVEPA